MAERRSLGDAMDMTPEKLAFIKGQPVKDAKPELPEPTPKVATEKTIEVQTARPEGEAPRNGRPRVTRRGSRGASSQGIPEASDLLDQVLVPVTIRLQHRTAQALRRAYLEQRLRHVKPDTQQEIVEEAVGDWLSKQGFLD
jgi:hypothetical protein